MHFVKPLLKVPHKGPDKPPSGKRLFFGQLLVETKCDKTDFAKEVANAVIIQAEQNRVTIDYTPHPDQFVTRTEDSEHVLVFEGNIAAYLRVSPDDARSFHVSFRKATPEDIALATDRDMDVSPAYVLTLSNITSEASELGDAGFWRQLGTNLWTSLTNEGLSGRPPDPDVKITIVYGDANTCTVLKS